MGKKYSSPRFSSFQKCLYDFKQAENKEWENDSFILSGIVQKFSLTLDISWKVMKDILHEQYGINDYAVGSPISNIKKAFSVGLIEDDPRWIQMIKLRNNLTRDYDLALARESCDIIIKEYIPLFVEFEHRVLALIQKGLQPKDDRIDR